MFKSVLLVAVLVLATGAYAQPTTLNDSEISKILLTINQGEIDLGHLAISKASAGKVKDFAKEMVKAHMQNVKDTNAIVQKAKVMPKDSTMSVSIKEEGKSIQDNLKATPKADFDREYVTQQIAMHEKALGILNDSLIPSVHNSALKTHLEKTRQAVMAHLEHARTLQSSM